MALPPETFDHLRALEKNWNSYEADPITEQAISTAQAVEFVPSSDGGVQIELHAGGADIEIEIGPDGWVEAIVWTRPSTTTKEP